MDSLEMSDLNEKEGDELIQKRKPSWNRLALYETDSEHSPFVSRVINRLANYEGGIVPRVDERAEDDDAVNNDVTLEEKDESKVKLCGGRTCRKKKKKKRNEAGEKSKKLGTILGVFFPCIQNIFGVILFIRMVWIVGTAGWIQAFCLVFTCCCCTLTTAISMSAIATNGVLSSGGSYFMISRALGPEFGGAVGFLFYLGTTVASSMYIVGAVEILLQYIAPSLSIFGPVTIPENAYNCYRLYGTCLLFFVFLCVFVGVKFVSKFSPLALVCVLGSIVCVYIGILTSNKHTGPKLCFLGDRLLATDKLYNNLTGTLDCSKNISGPIYLMYCGGTRHHGGDDDDADDVKNDGSYNVGEDENDDDDDEDCKYFRKHEVTTKPGMPGLTSGLFFENMWSKYSKKGNRAGKDEPGDRLKGDIVADITTSFVVLIGIFFPSVTGIMAGSNRSGDLEDAQKSIPIGTIGAVAFTSTIYLSCLLFFGATVEGDLLRDKIGESIGGGLIVAHLAWPNPWVITIGSFLSTFGAGLQSLVGAPRLLQAIAKDGIIPFLDPFAVTSAKGEPIRALFLTGFIAELGVLLANVDLIAPITTMFFLMCYCFTNLACAVQTILRTPNWRPRFKFYHWALSMFGVFLCLSLMFMSSWIYTTAALSLAAFIYKYIEYKGAEKEWGDGIRGLSMSAARFALLRLEEGVVHVKNFRPQLLILLKLDSQLQPKYRKLLTFAAQLKAGRGLTLVASVLEGDDLSGGDLVSVARKNVNEVMKREKTKGFFEVLVARDRAEGMSFFIQAAGLGGLRHNTVLLNWPIRWRKHPNRNRIFIDTLRTISERHLAVLIIKNIDLFPDNCDKVSGFIDVWWIVHDGGLLMLLPFLLTQHKVWKYCKLRIFTVAQLDDNSMEIRKDLEKFMYQLRIPAQVHVVELEDRDIRTYIHLKSMSRSSEPSMRPLSMPANVTNNTPTANQMRDKRKHDQSDAQSSRVHQSMSMPGPVCACESSCHHVKGQRNQVKFSASGHTRLGRSRESTLNADDDDDDDYDDYSVSIAHSDTLASLDPSTLKAIEEQNARRLRTAIRLNDIMRERSKDARLVLINLPALPDKYIRHHNYMEFLEALTRNMERVMMVRGGGSEVITIF